MLISDDQIGLFPFEAEDSEQYRTWVNQEAFTSLLGRCLPVTESQHRAWYQSITQSSSNVVFAVKTLSDHRYLGNVWLHDIHWINRNAELRIFLGGAQGKGFGTRASKLLVRFAFQKLGLHKVYLLVSTANPRACRAFEKAGFSEEGVLVDEFFLDGTYVDVKRMAVRNVAPETFEEFARRVNLHTLSHRGLNQELIPFWLRSGERELDGKIVSSAYGETPLPIQKQLVDLLDLQPDDIFLDLGAGGGGVLASVLAREVSAFGIEQNRLLVEAGKRYLISCGLPSERLSLGDFLTCPWPAATKLYSATSRFSDSTLKGLSKRVQATDSVCRIVTLGKDPDLSFEWSLENRIERFVSWNQDEEEIVERLSCWVRSSVR